MKLSTGKKEQPNEETAYRIAGRIIRLQQSVAGFLNRKTTKLPYSFVIASFVLLFLCLGAYCFYLLLQALN